MAPRGPPDPSPEQAAATEVAEAVATLLKGMKNIGIYRHDVDRYGDFLKPAHQAITRLLDREGSLSLKLGPYTLSYQNQVVYEDQDRENLTYKFYKDGMRFLVFRPGLAVDELLRFVLLAMENFSERALFQEDMVTRLWKEDLQHLEYVVVEGFMFADLSEEEVEVEVERIVAYLRHQLSSGSADTARFARLAPTDLELELSDVEQVRGGIVSGRPARPADRERVQDELLQEQKHRTLAKMVLILFQVVEHEARDEDREVLMESLVQVLDLLLLSDDLRGAVALLQRFEKVLQSPRARPRHAMVASMRDEFRDRMLESQRLAQVGQYLNLGRDLDESAVRGYLSACGPGELLPLLELLSGTEPVPAKRILVDLLAEIGRDQVEVFTERLQDSSSVVVKDMLAILQRIEPPDLVSRIAVTLRHPNVMIRLEGLRYLAQSSDPEALDPIERSMEDEDHRVRLGALRALATRAPRRSAQRFIRTMEASDFAQRDPRERQTVATALGETRTQDALDFFARVLSRRATVFGRAKLTEQKLLAVSGLQAMRTLDAFKVLNTTLGDASQGREILVACHKAAHRVKERLEEERRRERPTP